MVYIVLLILVHAIELSLGLHITLATLCILGFCVKFLSATSAICVEVKKLREQDEQDEQDEQGIHEIK